MNAALAALLGPGGGAILAATDRTGDAEDAIDAAMARHPDHADRIWHSFILLCPTPVLDGLAPMALAAHWRELLERVVASADTRPGTAVECCAALGRASALAPLSATGTGLYLRMWDLAGLPPVMDEARGHYEAIRGDRMDEQEAWLRAKLARAERAMPAVRPHVRMCPFTRAAAAAGIVG